MHRVVILGGGVGGTVVANVVAKRAPQADVTVVDRTGTHVYQPGFVYIAFGKQKPKRLLRKERRLLRRRVKLVVDEATGLDLTNRLVHLKDGPDLPYDSLVITTGAELHPELIPGHGVAHHFYSLEGALQLRQALEAFTHGRVVIAIGGYPYKCPPAPAEAACQLDYYFTKRGIRDQVAIRYLSPLGRPFPLETVSPRVQEIFDAKDIQYTTFFNVERIDPEKRLVHSLEGEAEPFDLLILIPPHQGAAFLRESGLTDAGGWIPTDKHTLEVKGHEGTIWALGDATDLPISKAGAAAHYEAKVLGRNLAARIQGRPATERYEGRVMCFFDAGFHKGIGMRFDYDHPPVPPRLNRRWYLGKVLVNKLYWQLVPKARL